MSWQPEFFAPVTQTRLAIDPLVIWAGPSETITHQRSWTPLQARRGSSGSSTTRGQSVLVGHSGGGAIVANILGRHPDLAEGALLVGCGCDPEAWRSRMRGQLPIGNEPNLSLLPLSLVGQVRPETLVHLIVGAEDDVAIPEDSRRYAEALQQHGVDARLTIEPGLGHNVLVTPAAFRELGSLVQQVATRGG